MDWAALFKEEINKRFAQMRESKELCILLRSGNIHRTVGGYPGPDQRMPTCCDVMRGMMKGDDLIVEQPPKGNGANLYIVYYARNHR